MKAIYIALVLSFFMIRGAVAQTCPATDVPDNLFQDTNGDGKVDTWIDY